jgi:nucleoside-diphosphate-sugar epimerase
MGATRTALVLGATGRIGGETAAALLRHGWHVVAMQRSNTGPAALANAIRVAGDASSAADVRRAAEGAQVIVHAVNPPGYRDWDKLVLPMIDTRIAAAKAVGARVVLPGTIYNYGPDAFPVLGEDAPQHPVTRKGRIRVELERRPEAASRAGLPALIVRFGDFFGPAPGNNWFSQAMVSLGKRLRGICPMRARRSRVCWTRGKTSSRSPGSILAACGMRTEPRWCERSRTPSATPIGSKGATLAACGTCRRGPADAACAL